MPSAGDLRDVQANIALDFTLSEEDMAIVGGLKDQQRQHDSTDQIDPWFKSLLQPEGPWPSRAELWDDHETYAADSSK